jgi:hypothetical protein
MKKLILASWALAAPEIIATAANATTPNILFIFGLPGVFELMELPEDGYHIWVSGANHTQDVISACLSMA